MITFIIYILVFSFQTQVIIFPVLSNLIFQKQTARSHMEML